MHYKKNKKISYLLPKSNYEIRGSLKKIDYGIVYTLYSDKFNSIEVGFAKNDAILETKLSHRELTLLDKKKGKKKDLALLINTLNELGIKYSENFNFKYSKTLIRHLSTLGWPVGRSLYKQRKIKKELLCA